LTSNYAASNNAAMDLPNWINQQHGRGKRLADALGIQPPVVSDWVTGKKAVPAARCQAIVRITSGAVTLQELRPDDWADYWPNQAASHASIGDGTTQTVAEQWA